eukprot:1161369-Prymnesium_polylepis.2
MQRQIGWKSTSRQLRILRGVRAGPGGGLPTDRHFPQRVVLGAITPFFAYSPLQTQHIAHQRGAHGIRSDVSWVALDGHMVSFPCRNPLSSALSPPLRRPALLPPHRDDHRPVRHNAVASAVAGHHGVRFDAEDAAAVNDTAGLSVAPHSSPHGSDLCACEMITL